VNQVPAPPVRFFSSGAALQDFILQEGAPGSLVIVPHRRLARQVWHKQRLASLKRGLAAWEPLPLMTLPDWWAELYRNLWPPCALAPPLVRLALWRRAIALAPPLEGASPDLEWAQALDEAHELLLRHALPLDRPGPGEPPLVRWRRAVTRIYGEILRERCWLAPGETPAFLLAALAGKALPLPAELVVVGLTTLAPVEESWLAAVARHLPVTRVFIRGNPEHLRKGYEFPDQEEEMAWVAARLLECRHDKQLPLHRLAVTSPVMDRYAPRFQSFLQEILGPAAHGDGWAYNLSHGPRLGDSPLGNAALLPLAFPAQGERREDLAALLLSPYYQALKPHHGSLAVWDRLWREQGAVQGWEHLQAAVSQAVIGVPAMENILAALENIWSRDTFPPVTGAKYAAWLRKTWKALGFPGPLEGGETRQVEHLEAILGEFTAALGDETLSPAEALAWLHHAQQDKALSGPGHEEAGLQVLGWLEIRGLDFDRVFCLGMNSAAFPGSARPLPLLSRGEREQVLGGTQESQDRFSREIFENLLGTAPHLTFTRPAFENQEPQVGTPFYIKAWESVRLPFLSRPDPAWLRAPSVQAALARPEASEAAPILQGTVALTLPPELRVTQLGKALGCPLRFVLEDLWGIRQLPEIDSGLSPLERGMKLHQVLARFLETTDHGLPPDEEADRLLKQAARQVLGAALEDIHWQAEWRRWFGDQETPGLLPAWLALERQRLAEGWRWLGAEVAFQGLTRPGWPFTLRGRLDRLDFHPETGELLVWDYKTGKIPNGAQVFDKSEEFQLPAYLLAVREGHIGVDLDAVAELSAGFIGLKSIREDHLRHQDFPKNKDLWPEVMESWEETVRRLGELLAAGEVRPAPRPAPTPRDEGACRYCPYGLLCGHQPEAPDEEGDG
jgi:ATP-dependent helicase/nuclease subunit B